MTAPTCRRCQSPMFSGILNAPAYCVDCCTKDRSLAIENMEIAAHDAVREIYERHKVAAEQEAAPFIRQLVHIASIRPPTAVLPPVDLLEALTAGKKP